ncbi:MAG TPA: hypothetical protein VFQ23_17080 [Anaerolineales bacterium]|nr:hypothetical protein [Anaerolineales bacterium]
MIDQKKRTYQSETLSLLTLKLILTEAKRESPPQTRKEEQSDEELALNLIASMKKSYKGLVSHPAALKAERASKVSMKKVAVLEP